LKTVYKPLLGSKRWADVPEEVEGLEYEDHLLVDGGQDLDDLLQVPSGVLLHFAILKCKKLDRFFYTWKCCCCLTNWALVSCFGSLFLQFMYMLTYYNCQSLLKSWFTFRLKLQKKCWSIVGGSWKTQNKEYDRQKKHFVDNKI